MRTREIKDLSIACEAMSRISGYQSQEFQDRLYKLIDNLLKESETPTKPVYDPADDDIPF